MIVAGTYVLPSRLLFYTHWKAGTRNHNDHVQKDTVCSDPTVRTASDLNDVHFIGPIALVFCLRKWLWEQAKVNKGQPMRSDSASKILNSDTIHPLKIDIDVSQPSTFDKYGGKFKKVYKARPKNYRLDEMAVNVD